MAVLAVLVAVIASPASASFLDVLRADGALDLEAARAAALESVASDPTSPDAVAAAGWWSRNLDSLPDPAQLLEMVDGPRDPELGWVLATIEAELRGRTPEGSLAVGEVAGPFGVFDTLDLERGAVPGDRDLPPLGTRWSDPSRPFRLVIRTVDGWLRPPELMVVKGAYLAAWSLRVEADFDGWMVVETRGSLDVELDGRLVEQRRDGGVVDPQAVWYRVQLKAGDHRLRAAIASRQMPTVRVGLLGLDGAAFSRIEALPRPPEEVAASTATVTEPPAAAALRARLEAPEPRLGDLMTAADLARQNGDPRRRHVLLARALRLAPDEDLVHLEMAWYALGDETGASEDADLRLAAEHLRQAKDLPRSLLIARVLAIRERRAEDTEQILGDLRRSHADDVRVQQLWVRESIQRGWMREAESEIDRLRSELPDSRAVADLRLDVLESLERWSERNALLQELARTEPPDAGRIDALATGCMSEQAEDVVRDLQRRADDPALDVGLIRLLSERGETEKARTELAAARDRWGTLPAFDELELVVFAGADTAFQAALDRTISRDPSDITWRSLAWRRGAEPFFADFRVDVDDVEDLWQGDTDRLDVILLLDQAVERIFPDGSSMYYYHGLSRALTPVGAQRAAVLQELPGAYLLQVRVHKADGTVVVPADLDSSSGSIVLRDIKPGDLVEEEYVARVAATGASRRGHLPPYVYRFADTERAFGLSEYVLVVPQGIDLKIDGLFDGLETSREDHDGLRVVRWRSTQVPPMPPEPYGPPTQQLIPWVTYGFNVTWQDVGDVIRDRAMAGLTVTPALAEWAAPLVATADPHQAFRRLVDALCDEVEAGRGVLSLGAPAGRSFSAREGNRLGILAGVLADAGWRVDLVLARPLPFARSHLEVPSLESFSRPVLRVSHGGATIWVDLEEGRRGIDHLSPILQGSDALVLPLTEPTEAVSLVSELPSFANPDLEDQVRLKAEVDASGHAAVQFEMVLHGRQAERLLDQVREVPPDRADQMWLQMAANLFPGAEDVTGAAERVPDGAVLRLVLGLDQACDLTADGMTCRSLVVARPVVPSLASLPTRKTPLILFLPIVQRVEAEITPPPGWRVVDRARRLQREWGSVGEDLEPTATGGLRSVLHINLPAQEVSPESYSDFARFCHAVDEMTSRPPVLERIPN
jgi:hypothetical protein